MAELLKFHEKNRVLFGTQETTAGTYEAPTATDALPVITLEGSITTETGSYVYLGDSLSRDEYSYIQDQYADFNAETPQQILGTLNGSLTVAEVPFSAWYQACGGYITVLSSALGSFPAGTVFIDNSQVSDEKLSIDYRLSSAQDTANHKLRKFYACQGTVDVGATLGDVPKVKFTMKGNSSDPIETPILQPNFGSQFKNVVASVRDTTLVNAEIAERDGTYDVFSGTITTITNAANIATVTTGAPHGLGSNGSIRFVTIGGATDNTYNGVFMITIIAADKFIYRMASTPAANASGTFTMTVGPAAKAFCFSNCTAANFFGFEYNRYKTGCETGFSKTAVPTDVTVSILETTAPATVVSGITSTTTTATATALAHGLTSGDIVTISEVTGASADYYNVTEVVATVLDADTFTYPIASYSGSFSGSARVVNKSFAKFDPDSNISNFFGAQVKFGAAAGKYVTYAWDKLQIRDVKEGKVDSYLGREISFRNTGRSFKILS